MTAQSTAAPARAGSLIIEPGATFTAVYDLNNSARRSIDVTMYEFADTTAEQDLAAAARRGVTVRVILDRREQSTNASAYGYGYFRDHGLRGVWSSPSFNYAHQKTIVVDGIMTANLTSKYYATSRDFLVSDTSHADVSAISAVFDAGFAHRSIRPGDGSDLAWSPTDSRQLLALINGARSSLRVYSEEMGDRTVEKALIAAAERGVSVQVCGESENG